MAAPPAKPLGAPSGGPHSGDMRVTFPRLPDHQRAYARSSGTTEPPCRRYGGTAGPRLPHDIVLLVVERELRDPRRPLGRHRGGSASALATRQRPRPAAPNCSRTCCVLEQGRGRTRDHLAATPDRRSGGWPTPGCPSCPRRPPIRPRSPRPRGRCRWRRPAGRGSGSARSSATNGRPGSAGKALRARRDREHGRMDARPDEIIATARSPCGATARTTSTPCSRR